MTEITELAGKNLQALYTATQKGERDCDGPGQSARPAGIQYNKKGAGWHEDTLGTKISELKIQGTDTRRNHHTQVL